LISCPVLEIRCPTSTYPTYWGSLH
jgi:hypothetical protein